MKRIEWLESDQPNDFTPMAELRMNGDQCEVVWFSKMLKVDIEDSGIRTPRGDNVFPEDGKDFYDAVDIAYANSSHIFVTQELDDSEWGQSLEDGYEPVSDEPIDQDDEGEGETEIFGGDEGTESRGVK